MLSRIPHAPDACVCESFTKQVLGLTPQNHSFMQPQLFVPNKLCQQIYHLARYSGPFVISLAVIQAGGVGESLRKRLRAPLDRRRNPPPTKSLDTVLLCLSFCWRLVRRRRCPGRAAIPPLRPPSLSLP